MTVQEIVNVLNFDRSSEIFSFCYDLDQLIDNNNIDEAVNCIQKRFNCDQETADNVFIEYKKQIYDEIKKFQNENPLTPKQIAYNNAVAKEMLNKPKCPTCSSTNVQKISSLSKAGSVAMFGIFS